MPPQKPEPHNPGLPKPGDDFGGGGVEDITEISGLHEPADPLLGKVLDGRFRLMSMVAAGGMGKVYRAEQSPLGRIVALKVLDLRQLGDNAREFRQRFIREAAACARLTHPNTVRIFDYGRSGEDILYIAMEFLDGTTLQQAIRTEAPMPPARVLRIGRQICSSLREAHLLSLIHRDLKPSNVMLTRHGEDGDFVKVLDFGLVKELSDGSDLTRTDAVVGSPTYMSPEQIRGDTLDARCDLYSLGVILYACITGKAPFTGENQVNILMAHLSNPPPPFEVARPGLQVPPLLEWAVFTCLEKDPKNRFASIEELIRALKLAERQLAGEAVPMPSLKGGVLTVPEDWNPSLSSIQMKALNPPPSAAATRSLPSSPTLALPHTQAAPPTAQGPAQAPSRSPLLLIGAALFALLVLGGGGLAAMGWWLSQHGSATEASVVVPAPAEATAAPAEATASPAEATAMPAEPATPAAEAPAKAAPKAAKAKAAPVEAPKSDPKIETTTETKSAPKSTPKAETKSEPKAETKSTPSSDGPKSDLKDPWGK